MTEKEYIKEVLETMHESLEENSVNVNNLIKRSAINGDYSININDFKCDDNEEQETRKIKKF